MASNSTQSSTQGSADHNVFFGQPIIGVAILAIVLTTFFTGLRVWSRALCATTFSAGNLVQLQTGLGRMFASLSPTEVVTYLKIAWSLNICYAVALTSVKISILCLYLRALRYDYVHLATRIILTIVVITHIWIIVSIFTVCIPLNAFWDISKRGSAYCHKFDVFWSHAGINIITDFLIFALPLTVLRKLRIPRRQKYALAVVFVLAFLVCIISLVRTLQFIRGMALADRVTVVMASWTVAEVNFAVICACLITINPALSRMFPRMWTETSDTEFSDVQPVDTIGHAQQNRRSAHDSLGEGLDRNTSLELGLGNGSTTLGSLEGKDLEEKGHGVEVEVVSKQV